MTYLSAWILSEFLTAYDISHGTSFVSNKVERILTSPDQTTLPDDVEWVSSYGDHQLTMVDNPPTEILRKSTKYVHAALPLLPVTEEGNRFFDGLIAECDAYIKKRPLVKK